MADEIKQAELFPPILRGWSALLWIVAVPMALLAAVDAFVCWLTWSELAKPVNVWWLSKGTAVVPRWLLVALALAALVPAVVAAVAACLRRRGEPPAWLSVALGGWCGWQFLAFVFSDWSRWMAPVPEWVVGSVSFLFMQLAGVTPAVFLGIWRLAGWQRKRAVSKRRDIAFSSLALVVPVVLLYLWVNLLSGLYRVRWVNYEIVRCVIVAGMVVLFVTLFIGLFRCLMWLRLWLAGRMQKNGAYRMVYAALVSLVLPLAGLALNRKIPFPADLQNGWAYALTVVNAAFLLLPSTGVRRLDAFARAGRLALFPFTCYFFVVFLPFLPFAVPAILAAGAGFLILTPVLLFAFHLQALADDRRAARASSGAGGRLPAWRTALCVAALPLAFAARTECDRAALHRALDIVYLPDYGQDARLGMPRAAVRRALVNARRFKTGTEYPILSAYVNWRVFDNLLLQEDKFKTLWRLFVGDEPLPAEARNLNRNSVGSLLGGRTRDTTGGMKAAPLPGAARLYEVSTTNSVAHGEVETRVTLTVTATGDGQQEYRTDITVPPGVWVNGLRLKIGGEWIHGDIIERKAADWVYRQITRVTRRDPAILRYEDDGRLSLRVFPVDSGAAREVELSFLMPEGFADAVEIGGRRVTLGDGTVRPQCVWAAGVLAKNRLWREPSPDTVLTAAADWLVLDCSAANGAWTEDALAAAARGMTGTVHVVWANAENVAESAEAGGVARLKPRLRAAGGLNADAALRRVARQCRLVGVTEPRVVFAGAAAGGALARVAAETWRGIRAEAPGLREVRLAGADGAVFPVPEARTGMVRVVAAEGDAWQTVDGRDEVLAFEGAADDDEPPVAGGVRLPPESKWARGAAAWRLQRELDAHPGRGGLRRDILRAGLGSDVLTTAGAYIVVENDMQRKMLHVKQVQTLGASGALDLVDSPAPDGWLLIAVLLALLVGRFVGVAQAAGRLLLRVFFRHGLRLWK